MLQTGIEMLYIGPSPWEMRLGIEAELTELELGPGRRHSVGDASGCVVVIRLDEC